MSPNRISSTKPSQEVDQAVVHGALLVTLRASRALALAPLSITAGAGGSTVTLSNMLCRASYFVNVLITIALASSTVWELLYAVATPTLGKHISVYCRVAHTTLSSLIILYCASNTKARMLTLVRNLKLIEKINSELKVAPNEKIKLLLLVVYFISSLTMHVILCCSIFKHRMNTHGNVSIILLYVSRYLATTRVSLLQAEYVLVMLTLKDTLKTLNDKLLLLSRNPGQDDSSKYPRTSTHATIRFLCLSFATIDDVLREVNNMYGFMIMMAVVSYFFYLLEALYDLIVGLLFQVPLPWLTILVSWFLHNAMGTIFLLEPHHHIQEQEEEVRYNLGKVLRGTRSFHDQVAFELELFYKQATLNRLTSQPMGLFAVSRSLLIPIAGTISTYLVITIQLEFF